ncbi:ATP-dependent dethiobiotin synthetase BioD [Candidatus Terasakiella magnetica]|uniref:ATP-dependent dethiobiotin synthetase BioD n=1 Tax=Candidatus Terasakiella magnetica TaxID=1867952 RepID=A0A1C3RCC9_9PROT|nr:dethiobiotin synthase [Candidatus Terasakiella magnetica]SCA54884.1 ATP-dependent dethiobiotin synthetase BioD [Candidatus Terasakiella magnetica]
MTTYFVTGTDTDIGKTVVSALLTKQLDAFYWKPVQSGTNEAHDKEDVQRICDIPKEKILPCAYELSEPLSPHEAARLDNVEIDFNKIVKPKVTSSLVIEGAGGVFVPLNNDFMMIDLIRKMECEAIIVARSGLGTINHTLLTLNALKQYDIPVKGVVLNGPLNQGNKNAIEQFGDVRILGEIPFIEDMDFSSLEKPVFDLSSKK